MKKKKKKEKKKNYQYLRNEQATKYIVIMAFFGLTALGPQNAFAAAARSSRNIQIFEEDDFAGAWEKVIGQRREFAPASEMGKVLKTLFRGPIPPSDQPHIEQALDDARMSFETPDSIQFDHYMSIMMKLKYEAEIEEKMNEGRPRPSDACEFWSSSQFEESFRKHQRMKINCDEKQFLPLTSTQELGWGKQELHPPKFPRGGSEITKFAAELVKSGVYY